MLSDKERIAQAEKDNEHQNKNIGDLWRAVTEQSKCIRRLEKRTWIGIGQQGGTAIALGVILGKIFGVFG